MSCVVAAVGLTAQAGPTDQPLVYVGEAALLLAGLGGAVLCGWGGWRRGRRGVRAWPAVTFLAVLWGVMLFVAGVFGVLGPGSARSAASDGDSASGWAVGALVVVSAAAVPAGFAIGMVCASLAGKESAEC